MRTRGDVYWQWAQPGIHFRNYDERIECGRLINIQVRISKDAVTQLFFGIYEKSGEMLLEEYYPDCRGQTPSRAMAWALDRAHDWLAINVERAGSTAQKQTCNRRIPPKREH